MIPCVTPTPASESRATFPLRIATRLGESRHPMLDELLTLWQNIRDPEYAHLLLESLPLYGIGIGLLFLFVAVTFGERKSRALALLIICLSSASVWPYLALREKAQPRIIAMHDPSFAPLIREQSQRRESMQGAYYALAVLSAISLVLAMSGKGRALLIVTLVLAVAAFWLSLWLHKKECEVYHRNIVRPAGR